MDSSVNPRRKVLSHLVAVLVQESGFACADKPALETLTEILQSFLTELGHSTRLFAEVAGRVEPTVGDFVLALAELGIRLEPTELRSYHKRHGRPILPVPQLLPLPKAPQILSAGKRRALPSYIPDYFPPMPDPHAYIRTPTHRQPLADYAACREKISQQKRDVERSLTKFYARTSPCFYLFPDNQSIYPLISPKSVTYLDTHIPRDQIFEEEQNLPPLNFIKKEKISDSNHQSKLVDEEENDANEADTQQETASSAYSGWELIDNPFLRPVKIQKKGSKK
jgi:transcription initiation factor TFIID subunit 8